MKTIMSLQLVAAFALLTVLAATPAFADQNTQVTATSPRSGQVAAPATQVLVPFKKWWTEN